MHHFYWLELLTDECVILIIKFRFTNISATKIVRDCQKWIYTCDPYNLYASNSCISPFIYRQHICLASSHNFKPLLVCDIYFLYYLYHLSLSLSFSPPRYLRRGFMEILSSKLKIVSVFPSVVSSPSDQILACEGEWNVL